MSSQRNYPDFHLFDKWNFKLTVHQEPPQLRVHHTALHQANFKNYPPNSKSYWTGVSLDLVLHLRELQSYLLRKRMGVSVCVSITGN